jgi:hypothetical protein
VRAKLELQKEVGGAINTLRHLLMNALGHPDEQALGKRDHEPIVVGYEFGMGRHT